MDIQTTIPIGAEETLKAVKLQPVNKATASDITSTTGSVTGGTFTEPVPFDINNIQLPDLSKYEDNNDAINSEIYNTLSKLEGKSADIAQAEKQLLLPEQRQELQDITGQLTQLQAEAQAQQAKISGQPIVEGAIQLQRADVSRRLQEQALPLAARANVIQGNIGLAEAQLARYTEDKYNTLTARLNTLSFLLDQNKDKMTRAESRQADALQLQLDERKRLLDEQKSVDTQKNNLFITAAQNNAPQNVLNQIQQAQTYEEALNVARDYLQTPVSELDQLRIQEQRLKNKQLQQEIDLTGDVSSSEYSTIINNLGNLVGSEKGYQRGQEVKKALAQTIANEDYVSGYAQIANSVGSVLTGETKSRYENARNIYAGLFGLKDAIQEYADAGGEMGILKGTVESVKRKLGIDSGEASELAVQLWREFQTYRNIMTGAAFTPEESRDYASVNPTLGKSFDLNMSVIDGVLNQLENNITSTINTRVPGAGEIYDKAFPKVEKTERTQSIEADFQEEVGIKEPETGGFWSNIGSAINKILTGK